MTDETLERLVRDGLAWRDPGRPPGSLGDRVRADRLDSGAARPWQPWATRAGAVTAAATASFVIALIGWLAVLERRTTGSVGQGPLPQPVPFDPTATGSGMFEPTGNLVVLVAFVAVVALAVAGLRSRRPVVRWSILAVAGLLGVVVANLVNGTFVGWTDGATAYGRGYVANTGPEDPQQQDDGTIPRFVVGPNGILTFGLDVHNLAPVPITIVGLVRDSRQMAWGQVTAVGLLRDDNVVDLTDPAASRPFEPVHVEPGASVFLIVAGKASPCSLDRDTFNDPASAGASFGTIDVAYEILGVQRVSTVNMPFSPQLPMDGACLTRS